MSVSEISETLENNPEFIKQSLEVSMKLQAAILKYVVETGKKVICDTAECDGENEVPENMPIITNKNYRGKTQYVNIKILDTDADEEYINSIRNRLATFEKMYVHFDTITAQDIMNADNI